jgi:hypothetical protein
LANALTPLDVQLFTKLGNTQNFEAVLESLLTARVIAEELDLMPRVRIDERYAAIQQGLVSAVHSVHVPWTSLTPQVLPTIRREMLKHRFVFTTNYDLLVYWAIMADRPDDFRDYFWGNGGPTFAPTDTAVRGNATRVLYLHGALHLYHGVNGVTSKEVAGQFVNLLDLFGRRPDGVPLCITEGTSPEKVAAIGRSSYLSFALRQLGRAHGPMVLFGQSLGTVDQHVADAINNNPTRTVAVSIFPVDAVRTIQEKTHLIRMLPQADIHFFDSRTHPLGDPQMRVP